MPAAGLQPDRLCLPRRKLLVLQNPGRGSRNYLDGILRGLRQLEINHVILELQEVWAINKTDPAGLVRRLNQILIEHHVGAVIGYGFNGMGDVPPDGGLLGNLRSYFEVRGLPHFMLWLDHPQWHADLVGLAPHLQGMFRSGNCYHFLKSAGHALEMERILGWPNCFELPAGVDPEQFPVVPPENDRPDYDIVAICSEGGELPALLRDFATLDDPNPQTIRNLILRDVQKDLAKLWAAEVPSNLLAEVTRLGVEWSRLKAGRPFLAAARHWPALTEQFPGTAWYLTMAYSTYMSALRILWRLREWERRFYLAYLSRHYRVGVFGGDWSKMGLGPGGWVDFLNQSAVYGRGRIALNITDGHDEEGLTMKPFEIAASGVPMLHYHAEGLDRCFEPGKEVAVFSTPRQAREWVDRLLDDPALAAGMASDARQRVLRDHTWSSRIKEMFQRSRIPMTCFRAPARQTEVQEPAPPAASQALAGVGASS